MVSKKPGKFVKDVAITFTATASQTALAFVITVILGKMVGAEDLGIYRLILTIYGLIVLVASIGIPSAVIKYVAELKDNKSEILEIVNTSTILMFSTGIVLSTICYLLAGTIAQLFNTLALKPLLNVLVFIFPFALINNTMLGLLNGLRYMKKYALIIVLKGLIGVLITLLLVLHGFEVRGAVWALLVSEITISGVLLYMNRAFIKIFHRVRMDTISLLTKFGAQIFGADAINILNKQLDIILIGIFLVPREVGYYAAAVSLSRFFWLIPASIQRITYPATSEYWSKGNIDALNNMINKSIKYTSIILVSIGIAVFIFSDYIIAIFFKKEFVHSTLPLKILLIGTVIRGSIAQPIGASLTGIGRPDLILKLTLFMILTNGLLDIILIPGMGIIGAAIATSVSLSFGAIINLVLVRKYIDIKINWLWLIKLTLFASITIMIFTTVKKYINVFVLGCIVLSGFFSATAFLMFNKKDWIFLKRSYDRVIKGRN